MGHRAVCMKFIVLLSLLLVYFSAELQNGDACIWCYWWRFIISLFTFIPFISFVLFLALTLTFADFVCVYVCVCLFFPLHCFALALFSSIWIHFIPRFTFDSVGAFSLLLMNDDNVLLIKAHVHAYLFSFFIRCLYETNVFRCFCLHSLLLMIVWIWAFFRRYLQNKCYDLSKFSTFH